MTAYELWMLVRIGGLVRLVCRQALFITASVASANVLAYLRAYTVNVYCTFCCFLMDDC